MSATTRGTRQSMTTSTICRAVIAITGILVLGVLIGLAIFYRPSGFQVELSSDGKVVLPFEDSTVSLADVLDKALAAEDDDGTGERLAKAVLATRGYYHFSDRRLAHVLRDLSEEEGTEGFTSAVRGLLYDLEGPFARPYTFAGARDGRLLNAFEDLDPKGKDPEAVSPLLSTLWRMNLNHDGVFRPRPVNASVRPDANVERNRAAVCFGSVLEGKEVMISGHGVLQRAVVDTDQVCVPRSLRELLAGQPEHLRLAPEDFAVLQGSGDAGGRASELQVTLIVSPKHFGSRISPPQSPLISPQNR
jgi:hypothetical protein